MGFPMKFCKFLRTYANDSLIIMHKHFRNPTSPRLCDYIICERSLSYLVIQRFLSSTDSDRRKALPTRSIQKMNKILWKFVEKYYKQLEPQPSSSPPVSRCCLLYSSQAVLHFLNNALGKSVRWHGKRFSGLFILMIIIKFNDVFKSRLERNVALFFFIIENTHFSAALLCGIVRIQRATELSIGNFIP